MLPVWHLSTRVRTRHANFRLGSNILKSFVLSLPRNKNDRQKYDYKLRGNPCLLPRVGGLICSPQTHPAALSEVSRAG